MSTDTPAHPTRRYESAARGSSDHSADDPALHGNRAVAAQPDNERHEQGPRVLRRPDDPARQRSGHDDGCAGRASMLAPFIAWMATQQLDETTRRRHRQQIEAYLDWCDTDDDGPTTGRRRRYENSLRPTSRTELLTTRAALDRYAEYRNIVARTIPVDR